MILDGFGLSEKEEGNAIALANTPNFDEFWSSHPHTTLKACGEAVGLMEGQMGNSEVGHLNLGAGRIVYQDIVRISKSIKDGSFFENKVLLSAVENVKKNNSMLHIMGLVSPGGVHSHHTHIYALLDLAEMHNVPTMVHAFLDGRDTPPKSAYQYISELEDKMVGRAVMGTVVGRYYAMDRDKRWERTKLAYDAIVNGIAPYYAKSGVEAVLMAYERGETDEFVKPTIITPHRMKDEDSVIFFNFRADRARQLTYALVDRNFSEFPTTAHPYFVAMTRYDEHLQLNVAFDKQNLENTFGEWISKLGLTQLRIAETEKYAHVTYFFSGGREDPFKGEDRVLVPSPKVPTYDMKPEMSAYEVTQKVVEMMGRYDVVVMNYANPDMVGHTGVLEAAIRAIEVVDECMGRVAKRVRELGGRLVITADHGNAEQMMDETQPHTAHTTNPVPFIILDEDFELEQGILGDVAPTLLDMMGIEKPDEMDRSSLIK